MTTLGGGPSHLSSEQTSHRTYSRPGSSHSSVPFTTTTPITGYPFSSLPSTSSNNASSRFHPPIRTIPSTFLSRNSFRRTASLRTVELCKDEDNPSFGFNIKGGTEFGVPVHIWRVEDNSLADRVGLKRGQNIVQANGVDFTNISHANALQVLKGRSYLKLIIDTRMNGSSSNLNKGSSSMMEGGGSGSRSGSGYFRPPASSQPTSTVTSSSSSAYTWIDARGNPVPPPSPTHLRNKRVINIDINPGQNLGLMIRGGYEYGLGIYVTGVDQGSLAQRAGLERGDEILEVNGRNFTSITHDKAVQILKTSRKMTIVACYIGKIPADNQQPTRVPPSLLDSENTTTELIDLSDPTSTTSKLLTTSMGETFHHHNILMDSTNVVTLFDDENEDLIAEEEKLNDQNLVLDFSSSAGLGMGGDASSRLFPQDSMEKSTSIMGMIEEKARTVLTKSEHSRFTFYRLEYQQGFLPIQTFVRILLELLNTAEKYTLLTEVREIIRPGDMVSFDELIYNKEPTLGGIKKLHRAGDFVGDPQDPMLLPLVPAPTGPQTLTPQNMNMNMNGVGMRRMSPNPALPYPNPPPSMYNETAFMTSTPESNRQLLITHGDTQHAMAKLQHQKLQGFGGATISPGNSCVRYKVRVQKTKPILGIAIEGGINTPHRLPRVIDVNTDGSAYGSQLKPGQVLLTVDGKKLDGLTHEEIARAILDSYVDMSKAQVEFVVVEAKASFVQSQQQVLNVIPPPPSSGNMSLMANPPMLAPPQNPPFIPS